MSDPVYECDCGWEGTSDEMDPIDDIGQRVEPGEFHPAGQCPDCQCLIGCTDADIVESGNLASMARILSENGYTVVKR